MSRIEQRAEGLSDLTAPSEFYPRRCADHTAIAVVEKHKLSDEKFRDLLQALGAEQSTLSAHISVLNKRRSGELDLFARVKEIDWLPPSPGIEDLQRLYEMPIHRKQIGSTHFRWTIDIYNPNNRECMYSNSNYDEHCEYVELVISREDFRLPIIRQGREASLPALMRDQTVVNQMLKKMWLLLGATFLFGSGDGHLYGFPLLHHFGPKKAREVTYRQVFWPWAIYSTQLRQELSLSLERAPAFPTSSEHPNRGLFDEELDDGALQVYTVENCLEDEILYCRYLGLQSSKFDFKASRSKLPPPPPPW